MEVTQEKLARIAAARAVRAEESKVAYKRDSRDRLGRAVATKLRTTMIGSLQAFEDLFGPLCGLGKSRGSMTEGELELRDLYEELRSRILNLGNGQIRALEAEIAQYDVSWNRYQYAYRTD